MMRPRTAPSPRDSNLSGYALAIAANLIWGIYPIYFTLVKPPLGSEEIVGWRAVFTFACSMAVLIATSRWAQARSVLRNRRATVLLVGAGMMVYANWLLYVIATTSGFVLEASLAYFITPIISVLLGVVVLRERARPLYWVSFSIALVAVVILIAGMGRVPWLGFTIALTFALYGFVKRLLGTGVDVVVGLTIENAAALPLGILQLVMLGSTGSILLGTVDPMITVWMVLLGVLTTAPFMLFTGAAQRLPLLYLGFVGYLTPLMIFISGVWYFREDMPIERWIGFGLIWIALAVLAIDMWRGGRAARVTRRSVR